MNYSIIIPIYNEERSLPSLLDKLEKIPNEIEVIIIDDGSNDQTDIILSNYHNFTILQNKSNIGKGAAIKKGVESASNQNIILMDGDLEIDIDDIPKLITRFEDNNIDAIVGIRWLKNNDHSFEINRIGNYLINSFFNLLYNSSLNDVLCCVRILDVNLFKSLDIQSNRFSIEVETMAKLVLKGLIIEEVIIRYNRRTLDEGKKLKISDSWSIIWTIIKLKLFTKS